MRSRQPLSKNSGAHSLRAVCGALLMLTAVAAHANTETPPANPGATGATVAPLPTPELRVTGKAESIATANGAPDLDKVVCKVESDTGSRIKSSKRCVTQRQSSSAGRVAAKRIDENATVVSFTD